MGVFIVFKVLGIILICIFLLILIVLVLPCKYNFSVAINDKDAYFHGEVYLICHLLKLNILLKSPENRIEISILGKKYPLKFDRKSHNNHVSQIKIKDVYDFLDFDFLSSGLSYIKQIVHILKPKYVGVKGTYGFYDPAETGFLCAFISMIPQIMMEDCIHICLNPNFQDEIIDIKIDICGKLTTLSIVVKTIKFVMKKEVRQVLISNFKVNNYVNGEE